MKNRLMISAAAVALIAGMNFANAQGTGGHEGGAMGGAAEHSAAPSGGAERGGPAGAPAGSGAMNHNAPTPNAAPGGMKSSQSEPKAPATNQRAEDNMQGQKPGNMRPENDKGEKAMNAEGPKGNDNTRAEERGERNGNMNAETKGGAENRSQTTTGQAAAGGKISSEQRTKITTVIREQHIAPVTNINFSVSVGTRVPRDVGFHPLPAEIVTIYPDWRGYEMFLVGDQIIIVNPRTLEIVAVIDA